MTDRDELILDHLGRYTISIRPIIEDLFFDGGNSGNALRTLVERQLIQRVSRGLEGNYSYYQLSSKGAQARGLPPNKSAPKSAIAVAQNLAALWFCCKSTTPRKRINEKELNTLFGAPEGGNIIHAAQTGLSSQKTVFRLFIPGESTAVKRSYARSLKKSAHDALDDKRLAPWIERGTFRFGVLVHSEVRKEDLERLLRAETFPKLEVHIEIVPTPSTLPTFILDRGQDDA
jgi:hypothetical protein